MRDLTRTFQAPIREAGLRSAVGSLFRREYREIEAVQEVPLDVEVAQIVGFIGPNGAGKTTTLKILSGILMVRGSRPLLYRLR